MADTINMNEIKKQFQTLCETYDLESFIVMLKRRSLSDAADFLTPYIKEGWIVPVGTKQRFHRGHMLILQRLNECNHINYCAGLPNAFDFEDIMSRRSLCSDLEAEYIKDDAIHIQQLFSWLLTDNNDELDPLNAVHTKALIELSLNSLDPDSFYENQKVDIDEISGTVLLVKDLIRMQNEISSLVSKIQANIPNVQNIYERQVQSEKIRSLLNIIDSPYLAIPRRDIMTDERHDFMRTRNELLIGGNYEKLIEHYQNNLNLFDSEPQRHANLSVCLGHIYADFLNNTQKAFELYQKAFELDPSNNAAFQEINNQLRKDEKWEELVELLTKHSNTVNDTAKRTSLILDTAHIQAYKANHLDKAIHLYQQCMTEGHPGNDFDNLYRIINGLMSESSDLEKLRALVILTLHINNFNQVDKVTKFQKTIENQNEPEHECLSKLIQAGLQSFDGDQPKAFGYLKEAIVISPENELIDGMLIHICNKMTSSADIQDNQAKEFQETVNKLSSEDLTPSALSNVWLKIATCLHKLKNRDKLAMIYAEKAIATNPDNSDAVDLAFSLAKQLGMKNDAFVYATLKATQTDDPDKKSQLDKMSIELKNSFNDDKDLLLNAYEKLLQYKVNNQEICDNIKDMILDMEPAKAVESIQKIDSACIASGLSDLIGDLYQTALTFDLSPETRKELLEHYIEAMLAKENDIDLDQFIPTHAQLYLISPNEKLFNHLRTATNDDPDQIRRWAEIVENDILTVDDVSRQQKIYTRLADCYQNIIKDLDKTAQIFEGLLKISPDNVPVFKCTFNSYERVERYIDCIDIFKAFPADKLSSQEKSVYCFKSLCCALIHGNDTDNAIQFFNTLTENDPNVAPAVIDQIIEKAVASDTPADHLISMFEQLEESQSDLPKLAIKLTRAKLLAQNDQFSDAALLLDEETKSQADKYNLINKALAAVELIKSSSEYDTIKNVWESIPESDDDQTKTQESECIDPNSIPDDQNNTIDDIVRECADNINDENATAEIIENALKTLNKEDATLLCNKLGLLFEKLQQLSRAEDFFKRAFGYTQSLEYLEFCKRQRKFKKAARLLKFKLDNAPEDEKTAVKLEWALVCEQMHDLNSALTLLDDVLNNKSKMDKNVRLDVLKQKAAYLIALNRNDDAVATLKQASQEADIKSKIEIDITNCLLMRHIAPNDATKLYQSLMLRGAKSNKMKLLSACFDIDNDKFSEAESKLNTLLDDEDISIKISACEQLLRLKQKRGDEQSSLQDTAQMLLKLSPEHPAAKSIIQ